MNEKNNIKVLLAEDEESLAFMIQNTLGRNGFEVTICHDGNEALRLIGQVRPDVLVADVMMPEMDGFELVRRMRRFDTTTPVLFLTARSAIDDVVKGFELGANDYLKKPFSMRELIVRLKALAERNKPAGDSNTQQKIQIGEYIFHPKQQKLEAFGVMQDLSFRESRILLKLSQNPNSVVNAQEILLELWGDDTIYNQRSLHVFITKLRKKMAHDKNIRIVNARSIGYKLIVDDGNAK